MTDRADGALALLAPADGVVAALADTLRPGSVSAAGGARHLMSSSAQVPYEHMQPQ